MITPEDVNRLFNKVLQEITQDVRNMMEQLWLNWAHLGVDDNTKVNNIAKLLQFEKDLHRDVISETRTKLEIMQAQVDKLKEETEELSKCLSVDITILDFKEDMMLVDYKKELEEQIAGYREQVEKRRMKMERLLEWQRDLADKLGVTIRELQDVPLPSEEELDRLKEHLEVLQAERDKRAEIFLNTQVEVKDIMEKLQVKPQNKFEQVVMSSLSVDFKVTDLNMDRLAKLHQDLQEKYEQTNNRVLELRERLSKLWDCLDEDQIYRDNFLHAHPGCHPYTEAAIKEEIKRCEQIKRQKIQVFVANMRTKIKLMWDSVMYSVREREEFLHYYQDIFTEDTLTLHELYLEKLTKFYNDHNNSKTNFDWTKLKTNMRRLKKLIDESDSDEEVIVEEIITRRPRRIKEQINLFDHYNDHDFAVRFRLSKEATLFLLARIKHNLPYVSDGNFKISPMNQLLGTLRFYATNSTRMGIGRICGLSVPTTNKIINRVSASIAALHQEFIKFPNSQQEINDEKENFYRIAHFPRVIGAMDCTHVKLSYVSLRSELGDEFVELYRNKKGYYSINVQTICNPNLEFTDIEVRWPGSYHNSTIFNNSVIKAKLENGSYRNAFLLVDAEYASPLHLMPPLENPQTPSEKLYNESQITTRNTIERCYEMWKRRFPVLAFGMGCKLEEAFTIIIATAVLHNILCRRGESLPPDDPELELPGPWEQILNDGQISEGIDVEQLPGQRHGSRDALIADYFQSLIEQ